MKEVRPVSMIPKVAVTTLSAASEAAL